MKLKCLAVGLLASFSTCNVLAGGSITTQTPLPWSLHQGTYLGADIGGNLNEVSFEVNGEALPYTDFHSVAHSMFLGYFFNPHWAAEGAIVSYFSGMGLSARGNIRGAVALNNRIALSLGGGAIYITTPLKDSFIGPYVDVRASYALTSKIDVQATISDAYALYQFNNSISMTNHFLSFLAGFTYHI